MRATADARGCRSVRLLCDITAEIEGYDIFIDRIEIESEGWQIIQKEVKSGNIETVLMDKEGRPELWGKKIMILGTIAVWDENEVNLNRTSKPDMTLLPIVYATMLPGLVRVAKECGYALAVHGSLKRDMDLVAIPWVEEAVTAKALIQKLSETVRWKSDAGPVSQKALKPHGREAWVLPLGCGLALDVSVMPRKRK
jgi:hypothetical protein